jgi:hypothetical protein
MNKKIIIILFTFIFLISLVNAQDNSKRRIFKNVEINVLPINDTIMAICPPKDGYYVEPGETVTVKLFIRNAMNDKTIKRIYLNVVTDERFNTSYSPNYLENLGITGDTNVQFFLVNFTAHNNMPFDDYDIRFDLGTDEFEIGSYTYDKASIKVRSYSNEFIYTLYTILIIIAISLVIRFLWIINTNKKAKEMLNKPKHKKKRKIISEKYYKKK